MISHCVMKSPRVSRINRRCCVKRSGVMPIFCSSFCKILHASFSSMVSEPLETHDMAARFALPAANLSNERLQHSFDIFLRGSDQISAKPRYSIPLSQGKDQRSYLLTLTSSYSKNSRPVYATKTSPESPRVSQLPGPPQSGDCGARRFQAPRVPSWISLYLMMKSIYSDKKR